MYASIDTILVPQGIEYRRVCQGLRRIARPRQQVLPIPVGPLPLTRYLKRWCQGFPDHNSPSGILVMGLCGGLTPDYAVGDVVIYQGCLDGTASLENTWRSCDTALTLQLQQILQDEGKPVKALTSDRLIHSAIEKRRLGEKTGVNVVDMEGFVALEQLQALGIPVAMIRVVSDACDHDLPDLTAALDENGALLPLPLALGLLRQPEAATRLIRGALHGVRVLQQVTTRLFQSQDCS